MDEFRENGRLRGALDASLSGLNGDPYLARRLIACAEKQPKAVRKRSIGLVFAFVALLAAVSVAAAAALNLFEQFGQSERRFAEIAPANRHRLGNFLDSDRKNGHGYRLDCQRLL